MIETAEPVGYPFAAVVGMERVKLALLLGAVEPRLGGVLLRGEKGSAKTTLARGLAALLPGDPPPPFVDLPIGATEDRVVGTLDLSAVLHGGERRFAAGLLSAADGGVLYVDEVNLLPDHLVDVLLDVAVSGVNRVERDGVSVQHAARFFLVGSMNPEEGELRPQLLDRFGLAVDVASSTDPAERAEAVRRRLAFDADPVSFVGSFDDDTSALATQLDAYAGATVPSLLVEVAARMAVSLGADGLRADLSLCRAAAALAGLSGRSEASVEDLRAIAELALGHRRRRGPFDSPGISEEELDEALADALRDAGGHDRSSAENDNSPGARQLPTDATSGTENGDGPEALPAVEAKAVEVADRPVDGEPVSPGDRHDHDEGSPAADRAGEPARRDGQASRSASSTDGGGTAEVPAIPLPVARGRFAPPGAHSSASAGVTRGRHSGTERLASGSGRPVSAQPAGPAARRLALAPTAIAAAARRELHPASGSSGTEGSGALVEMSDLREVVAERRLSHLIVLCVDASGSMGAEQRASAARGAVLRLLTDAYLRRDRVAVVSFSGEGVQVVLRPTGAIEVARSRLAAVPTGGRTPLAEAIMCALDVCLAPSTRGYSPVLVVVSDGRATAAPDGLDPVVAALSAADRVTRAGIPALVVDVESGPMPLRLGETLAERMGARYLRLGAATAEGIDRAVRSVLVELQPG